MAAPTSTTGTMSATALHHYRGLNCEYARTWEDEGVWGGTTEEDREERRVVTLPPECADLTLPGLELGETA